MQNSKLKSSKVVLFIDTSSNKEIKVGIQVGSKKEITKQEIGMQKAQVVLPLIRELLKKHRLTFEDISSIKVNPGPGSFTGLRVGISIANALSYALKIPVNGKKLGEFVEPVY